jgi:hypothetical protein
MLEVPDYPNQVDCDDCGDPIITRSETDSDIYADDSTDTLCRRCYVENYLQRIMEAVYVLREIDVDTIPLQSAVGNVRDEEDIRS